MAPASQVRLGVAGSVPKQAWSGAQVGDRDVLDYSSVHRARRDPVGSGIGRSTSACPYPPLPGIDRDHGGGRSGAWSQRSGQHVANDSLPDERPEHHAEPSAAAAFTQR
jgi:hypothetical protein